MKSKKRKQKESKLKENDDPSYVPSSQEEDTDCGTAFEKGNISNLVNILIS